METELAAIDHVSTIHHHGPRLVIKVRAVAVWKVPFSHITMRPSCIEMILMDRKGTKIQASVCREHPILRTIQTGRVYKFSNFRVLLNDDVRYTAHDYRLKFHTCTIISESYDVRIPRNGWTFCNTQVIRARGDQFTHLIDCVGVVCAASQEKLVIRDGQMTKMLVIELQDSRGKIKCTLIESVVNPMAEYLASNWTVRPIVVFQFVKVKRNGDKFVIEGIPVASKVLINPDIPEVDELTHRMSVLGLNYHGPVGFLQTDHHNLSMKDDMLNTHPRKTLTQLLETKEGGIFIVHAAIVGVLRDGHWAYPSCRCFSELRRNGINFDCLNCGRTIGQTINRFRFKVEVFDGVDSAVFVLYDHEAEQLTGFSCEELINTLELEKRDIIEGEYPDDIEDNIAGKEMLFKVRNTSGLVYAKDVCFEVMRICFDLDIIAMFHEDDVIATPTQAKFIPPFTKMDSTIDAGEHSSSLNAQLAGFSDTNSSDQSDRRIRRKLLAVFESDVDESHDGDVNAGETNADKSVVDYLTDAVEDLESANCQIVSTDDDVVYSAAGERGNAVAEHISTTQLGVDGAEDAVIVVASVLVDIKCEFAGAGKESNAIDADEHAIPDSGLVNEESHVEEDMDDNLDDCGIKSYVKIEVVENYVDQFMDKVEDGNGIIVISDDDEFDA